MHPRDFPSYHGTNLQTTVDGNNDSLPWKLLYLWFSKQFNPINHYHESIILIKYQPIAQPLGERVGRLGQEALRGPKYQMTSLLE